MRLLVFEATTEKQLDIASRCHHDWYVQAGYITPYPDRKYQDKWSEHSKYFLVTESGKSNNVMKKDVIGLVRLILSAPFPINVHFALWEQVRSEIQNIPLENQCEVTALCWAPKCRVQVFPYIIRAIRQCTKALNKSIIWACLDKRFIPILQGQMLPFHLCGETMFYMGSDTIPLFVKPSEIIASLPGKNPELYKIIEKELDVLI
jgi:hypothetical protein